MAARNAASERIASAIVAELDKRGMTRQEFANRIEKMTGKRPGRQWLSRTLSGGSHFTVQIPSEIPNELLLHVAHAIDPKNGELLARKLSRQATKEPPQPTDLTHDEPNTPSERA